jgi:hypothetical protein
MLFFILAITAFVAVRAVQAVIESLSSLPRSNQDWIWY